MSPPGRDNARRQPGVIGGQEQVDSPDCASQAEERKLIATAIARAALLGVETCQIEGGAWLLRHARGAEVCTVRGAGALCAAVEAFEAACRDVRELVQRMGARA